MSEPENPKTPPSNPVKDVPEAMKKYQWKKGQSGNPNGRPKGRSMRSRFLDLLAKGVVDVPFAEEIVKKMKLPISAEEFAKLDIGDALALMGLWQGMKGRSPFYKEIIERSDGRVTGAYLDTHGVQDGDLSVDDERKNALKFYRSVVNSDAPVTEKLKAQQRIDDILGLTQAAGTSADEQAAALRDALRSMESNTLVDGEETPDGDDEDES